MSLSPVPRALYGGALALFALYGGLAWLVAGGGAAGLTAVDPGELRGTPYRVVTANGEEHLLVVDSPDPAEVLVRASAEFGDGARVEHVDAARAAAILQAQRGHHVWLAGLLVFPFAYLFAATRLRRRDADVASVLDALRPALSDSVASLCRKAELSEPDLARQVTRIRKLGLAELQWDEQDRRVYDARLSAFTITLQTCPHCHDPIHVRMRADLTNVPRCPQCMTTFDRGALTPFVADVAATLPAHGAAEGSLSLPAFALWTLVFPPAALYLAWRASA